MAPYLSLNDDPPNFRGRKGLWEGPRSAKVGEPLALIARIMHPEPGTWLGWTLHQGPGPVEFSPATRLSYFNVTMLPGSLLRIHALATFVHPCTAGWQGWLRLENANNSKMADLEEG